MKVVLIVMYGARIREVGEILEGNEFKTIYHCALYDAKAELYARDLDCVVIEFFRFEDISYCYNSNSDYPICNYIGEEHIAYIAVSRTGYTIDCPSGVFDIDRAGWKSKQS